VNPFRRALLLEYFTVGYNVGEGVAAVVAGHFAGSIALIGFGLDSAIESASGAILIWRLKVHGRVSPEEEERVEKKAARLVGLSFFALGAYVLFESLRKLYLAERPEASPFGIALAAASLIIMPVLSYAKLRTALRLGSRAMAADSRQTFICSLLSAALLAGLGANYLWGVWWADPVSALVIVFFIAREGIEAMSEGKACGC
jgi:divalent metal cation (Fe/Co/Zn/Cd) transporter